MKGKLKQIKVKVGLRTFSVFFQESKDLFNDISQILIKIAQRHNRHWRGSKAVAKENPTIGEVMEMRDELVTVWDRFQYGISKEEMYPDQGLIVSDILDTMRQLPIVGKHQKYILIDLFQTPPPPSYESKNLFLIWGVVSG